MKIHDGEEERRAAHATLVRLANSCLRAAARGKVVSPIASDLNEDDYKTIADILTNLAKEIAPDR